MEKLEKQVNEAEVEREIARWFTKKTALGVLGVIALIYIWVTTHIQHPQLPQGPDPSSFVQPPAVPKVPTPPVPRQTVVDDPRIPAPVRQAGWTEQYPPSAQVQAVEDPKTKILNDHIQREHDSAFASMLAPEERAAVVEPKPVTPPQAEEPKMVLKSGPVSTEEAYVIPQGTVASLILDSRIESEHAGPMDAHFVRDVYLPGTRTVVIPKGSRVIGDTTTVAAMNQRRLAVSFNKIQRDPADRSCDISLTEPALDEAGASGLTGSVNTHVGSLLAGSALAAVLQGVSMGAFYNGGGGYGPTQVIIGNTMSGMSQTTARLLDRFIKLPSITVHEGGLADFPFTKDTPVKPCGGPA
jgi:type IV secretory pathway VirB10-like protein